jgi:hypothetical protein
MDEDLRRAIEVARATLTDEQWETMGPRERTKLIYDQLRRIDAVRAGIDSEARLDPEFSSMAVGKKPVAN